MELAISLSKNSPCSSNESHSKQSIDAAAHISGHQSKSQASSAEKIAKPNAPKLKTEAELAILSSLPQSFCNTIQQCSAAESMVTIRASCLTEEDFALWLDEYKSNTHTSWISDCTFPNAIRQKFKKKFVCRFSSRNKGPNKDHHRSRNKSCKASLSVSIKKITRDTKKRDPFVRQGLPAVIKINSNHNHLNRDAHILSMLSMSSATKDRFLTYFNNGMTPSAAISYHVSELEMASSQQDLADASLNPLPSAVYHLHSKWRKEQLETACNHRRSVSTSDDENTAEMVASERPMMLCGQFCAMLQNKVQQYSAGNSESVITGLNKALSRLSKVKSESEMSKFLHNFGSGIPQHYRTRAAIRMQPTALSRRRTGITRGSIGKHLPNGHSPSGSVRRSAKHPHCLIQKIDSSVQNTLSH